VPSAQTVQLLGVSSLRAGCLRTSADTTRQFRSESSICAVWV
jgi:hypothetical protein